MPKVSILILTLYRQELALPTITKNLERAGTEDFEILICDQGTEDEEFINSLKQIRGVSYFRENKNNEGIARALNQLILRRKGEHVFFMPDDILLPENWLVELLKYAEAIPESGIIGFEGQNLILPEHEINGLKIHMKQCKGNPEEGVQVFGATFITKKLLEIIGAFCEGYHPYGLEDSDYCFRCHLAGLLCYYIPGLKSEHLGTGNNSGMKDIKEFCYWSNLGFHRIRCINYYRSGLFEPWPMIKDSIL